MTFRFITYEIRNITLLLALFFFFCFLSYVCILDLRYSLHTSPLVYIAYKGKYGIHTTLNFNSALFCINRVHHLSYDACTRDLVPKTIRPQICSLTPCEKEKDTTRCRCSRSEGTSNYAWDPGFESQPRLNVPFCTPHCTFVLPFTPISLVLWELQNHDPQG